MTTQPQAIRLPIRRWREQLRRAGRSFAKLTLKPLLRCLGHAKKTAPFALLALAVGTIEWAVPAHWTVVSSIARLECLLLVIAVGLRAFMLLRKRNARGQSTTIGGCARFANPKEIEQLTQPESGLIIGRDAATDRFLRYHGPAHLLTMASAEFGRDGAIIPNLLLPGRSVVCIDTDGCALRICGDIRRRFGAVHVLDPFGITGQPSAAFNPLQALDPQGLDFDDLINTLAGAIVIDEPHGIAPAYRNRQARQLVADLIRLIVSVEPTQRRHLGTLRDYLHLDPDRFEAMLRGIETTGKIAQMIESICDRHFKDGPMSTLGVLHLARHHCNFLVDHRINAMLEHSSFSFPDLCEHIATVFLVLPSNRLATHWRWLRLIISQGLCELIGQERKPATPVLYLLDETSSFCALVPQTRAMAIRAGSGVQLWTILRDVRQLHAHYGRRASVLLSGSAVFQIIGVNDHDTACFVSNLICCGSRQGQTVACGTALEKITGIPDPQKVVRPLMTAREICDLPQEMELLLLAGQWPLIAARIGPRQKRGLTTPAQNDIAALQRQPHQRQNGIVDPGLFGRHEPNLPRAALKILRPCSDEYVQR